MKILLILLFFLAFTAVSSEAQNAKITSLVIEPIFPSYNTVTIGGYNISSTPIFGEFNPRWETCRACSVNTEISLSVYRNNNSDSLGPIGINGSTTLTIDGVIYDFATGWLEMTFTVPPAKILLTDKRKKNLRFSRQGVANMHIKLWRNGNDYPNAPAIFEQSLQMNCTAYLNVARYRNSNGNGWLHDTQSYQWNCTAVD